MRTHTLNTFIIYVAFPALILGQVHGLHLEPRLLLSILMPWVMFVVGAALFWLIARFLHLPPTTTDALMLTGGLGNTSFTGLPMIEAFYGKSGIATGILIDTLDTSSYPRWVSLSPASTRAARPAHAAFLHVSRLSRPRSLSLRRWV